ncbi:Hypp6972 [Branchiostoma lanceolatum]|uniref:Hypp6972 protein n=1 Tax=Branchiostoma lanceolatum TaxID=7740 RepID=A0A8K0E5L0_BRALA|nr:Hypp6972 [Branchiostoma lanceolatum]
MSYSKLSTKVKRSITECGIKKIFHARGCRGGKNIARPIPVVLGNRRATPLTRRTWQPTMRETILRTCEKTVAEKKRKHPPAIPSILLCNPRSLVNRLEEFQTILLNNNIDIAAVTESWFTPDMSETHLAVDGYNLFSRCRTHRRGGGVALYVKDSIPAKVVQDTSVPPELECLWISARPRRLPRGLSELIICTVYNPPASPHQDALVEHLLTESDRIRTSHPEAGLILLGDFNRLDTKDICGGNGLTQVVDKPTRGQAILDVIITDLQAYYSKPEITSPLGLSDHNMVLWRAKSLQQRNETKTRTVRPMRDSDIRAFGQWLCSHQWQELYDEPSCEGKSAIFYETTGKAIEQYFPMRQVKMHSTDKPWISPEVKSLILRRQKAFSDGKTLLWKHLRNRVNRVLVV